MGATLKRLKMAGSWALALALVVLIGGASEALASCGSAACFLLTGEEGAVQLEGKLSVGLTYAYTISKLQSGTSGFVTAVDQEERRLIMNEHAEHRTILEVTTLDVNYGLTNNLTLELLVPYKHIKHTHIIERGSPPTGEGEYEAFQDAGICGIVDSDSVRHSLGGSPANVALGLARLGLVTRLHTAIGHDEDGEFIRQHLAASGVIVRAESSTDTASGTSKCGVVRRILSICALRSSTGTRYSM